MNIKDFIVNYTDSLSFVFTLMSQSLKRLYLVFDGEQFKGVISIGDIQRAIIANIPMEAPISKVMRREYTFATINESEAEIKYAMLKNRMEFMPIVDEDGNLQRVIFWEDVIEKPVMACRSPFNLPVVIMAGGQGTRLKPLTNVLPKPLIPISEKTILEDIMDRFVDCGSNHFYMSVNYKADLIKTYFELVDNSHYILDYFQESKPLGTAGSLKLLTGKLNSTFFVSNCDILINEDYSEILRYHRENKNELTLVVAVKDFSIPYGVVETAENGLLKSVSEKPKLDFKINTGMYILEPHLIEEIPDDTFFHIMHLMERVMARKGRIGCFPISEKSWIDVGNWNEYFSIINKS